MKKVSVVIAAYNKADLTVRTVESVLNQSYENIEIIVVDDGSTDDTRIKLLSFGDRIRYVYKSNGGACSARNLGIRLATGEYIGLLDCDDIYYPEKIALSIERLDKNFNCGFIHSPVDFIDDNKNVIISSMPIPKNCHRGWVAKKLLVNNFICQSTVVARKSCFDRVGLFDESIFIPADWDMWLRLAENFQIDYIDLPLTGYRLAGSYAMANLHKGEKEELFVLNKALARNQNLPYLLQRRAFSRMYLRFAKLYALREDMAGARQRFLKASLKDPLNIKPLLWLIYSFFFSKKIHTKLEKQIPLKG